MGQGSEQNEIRPDRIPEEKLAKKAADKKGGEATLKLIKKGHKDYHECVGLQAVGRGKAPELLVKHRQRTPEGVGDVAGQAAVQLGGDHAGAVRGLH